MTEVLSEKGFYLETEDAVKQNDVYGEKYKETCDLTGIQFLASGKAEIKGEWRSHEWLSMERDGKPSRVVMDDLAEDDEEKEERGSNDFAQRGSQTMTVETPFWSKKSPGT